MLVFTRSSGETLDMLRISIRAILYCFLGGVALSHGQNTPDLSKQPININTASASELGGLPGISTAKVQTIVMSETCGHSIP